MKYKSIRCNSDAVGLILDGQKTEMRLIMKRQDILGGTMTMAGLLAGIPSHPEMGGEVIKPPHQISDVLWVRETWNETMHGYNYKASPLGNSRDRYRWHPSIHMPREAARLFLRVKDVRVERLQCISTESIAREGIWLPGSLFPDNEFAIRWDSALSKEKLEKCGWEKNPWVWVVSFEKCDKPEDWDE